MSMRTLIIAMLALTAVLGCGGGGAEVELEAPSTPEAQQAMEQIRQTQEQMLQHQKEMMERAAIPSTGSAPPTR